MKLFNPRTMYVVAKKEFLDNIRNKWVIVLTLLFALIIIFVSYAVGSGETFGNMQNTVLGLLSVTSFLIPLIAIILGFSTISGEAESGALNVVLSYPAKRIEVLLGKLLGLGFVIIVSVFIGFGVGGVVIALTVGPESWVGYIAFIFLTIFLGFIYLSLAICISAFCKRRITSIGGGILVFCWSFIYGIAITVIFYATGGTLDDLLTGILPDWFYNSVVFSPGDLHQAAVQRAFGVDTINAMGYSYTIPESLSLSNLLIVHIIWLIVPLVLAYIFFKKRDI
jgi:Cu-processing system permease protein